MKKVYLCLLLGYLSCLAENVFAQATTFNYTGALQTCTVPVGYYGVSVDMSGAQGGASEGAAPGGLGGRVQAILSVSSGQVLNIYVGSQGTAYTYCLSRPGGYNGGGTGTGDGGGGGGMSDIRIAAGAFSLTNEILVAGGGGGGGLNYGNSGEVGGSGGGLTGGLGSEGSPASPNATYCGSGGTQSGGGLGATGYTCTVAGTAGQGGNATTGCSCYAGGGGGGYYGGGGGAYGGGGGGSSFYGGPGVVSSSASTTPGYRAGNGIAIITPIPPSVTASPSPLAFGSVGTGTTSSLIAFVLTGVAVSGANITVTPPNNFQVSPDGVTWYTNTSPYTFSYPGNSFSKVLFAEFLPTAITSYSGNILVTGGGLAATYNLPVTGAGATPCSGTPTAGSATINGGSSASGNGSSTFILNAPTATVGGGITYQWQVSTTSSSTGFTNIPGANTASYIYTGLVGNSWFQCVVSCGTNSATTTTVSATFTLPTACIPSSEFSNSSIAVGTTGLPFTVTGSSGSISDASVFGSGTGGSSYYYNNVSQNVTFTPGGSYVATMGNASYCNQSGQIWIDFNDNGTFETSESVGGYSFIGTCPSVRPTPTITIPTGAQTGAHRMRVVNDWDGGDGPGVSTTYPCYPSVNACPNTSTYYADSRDYTAIIALPTPTLTVTPSTVAFGNVTTLTSSAPVGYFTLSGSNLLPSAAGIVTVTSPSSNFLVSTNGVSWTNSILLTYLAGTMPLQNVYVQFNPGAVAGTSYTANLTISGGSASTTVTVTGTGQVACTGTPAPGTASISTSVANASSPITLSLALTSPVGGLTYQWLSSATSGGIYTPIAGAITPTYNFVGMSAATFYECSVNCPTGSSATSNIVSATFASNPVSACTVPASLENSCIGCGFYVAAVGYPFICVGDISPGIDDNTALPSGQYGDETATMSCVMHAGGTYTTTIGGNASNAVDYQFWIDFNNNGTFEASESVGGINQSSTDAVSHPVLTIPGGIANGVYRMRVMNSWGLETDPPYILLYPNLTPCPAPGTDLEYYEIRDYKVIFGTAPPANAPPCAGPVIAGIVSPSIASSCNAFSPSLFNVGEPVTFTGLSYQWQTSSTGSAPWTSISGATGQNYVPSTISTIGTTYYRDTIACAASSSGAATPAQAITLNPNPAPIAPSPVSVCSGLTVTLTDATTGGAWSSANTNATVGSATGVVTGVSGGTVGTISYTLTTGGCFVTQAVTVNLQPASISGTTPICGSLTASFTDATTGGAWSSANTAVATIGSTGTVTGGSSASVGSTTISYTSSSGCSVIYPLTVNALSAITGTPSTCLGFTTTLADATPGGGWSSSNAGVATINSSGVISSVSIGSTTINYTMPSGCVASLAFNVTSPPNTYAMTGGGSYCSSPTPTVHVGINGSDLHQSYQLVNTLTGAVGGVVTGTGFPIDFGAEPAGTYYVVAGSGLCQATMSGTSTVTVIALPTAYAVTGGGAYCPGGTGMNVFLNNSTIGVNYQLFVNGTPVGSTVNGTGSPINFGLETTAGTYTVVATSPTTTCVNNMTGSAVVSISTPPQTFTVGGGGQYCVGGTGYTITLSGSNVGTNYQLTLSGASIGAALAGTGSGLTFGPITAGGVYNIVATQTSTGCSATMSGTAPITVNPLPTVFTVTGGGPYCIGSATGVPVGLNGSTVGVNYQLWYTVGVTTTMVGSPVPGTGVAITFPGPGTGGTFTNVGSYSVVATNPTTTCSSNMFGSVAVFTNPLPATFSVGGGGNYCSGGTGVAVTLSGSVIGTTYNLFDNTTLVSAASGTGASITFGTFTGSGTYTVSASTLATGCNANMAGSTTITITPLPNVNTVTGGGSYCTGATLTGVSIGLSASTTGINYQLYNGSTLVSTLAGTGSPLSFTNELAGTYTIVAATTTTPVCTSNMTGSIAVIANALPTLYSVTGGGNYCSGAVPAGVHVGLSSSNTGISYALYRVGGAIVSAMPGAGSALDFGLQATAGTYKIAATNTSTGCVDTMSGSAVVIVNSLPTATYTVTTSGGTPGGAQYCFGGTGVNIGTSNSDIGVNYQLASSGVLIGASIAGSGSGLSFGPQTGTGPYTVIATSAATSCSTPITGSVTVTINPVPPPFSVTGGGPYCNGALGTTGALVGLSSSSTGIQYQLYNGLAPVGAAIPGTGGVLSFGLIPNGNYTVIATNLTTTCSATMSGSATVVLNTAPVSTYFMTGGGAYCNGGTGEPVGLSSSSPGVAYQLMAAGLPVGAPLAGTGIALNYGLLTAAGAYTVIGTNTTNACSAAMTGTATVSVATLPVPHNVTGSGNFCPGGTGLPVGLNGSNVGTTYQLYNGSTLVPGSVTGTGVPISFGLQTATGTYTVVGNNGCTGNMTGSATIGLYSLPVAYNVTGGGNYCPGGTGVAVGLSGSAIGLSYQLQNGAGPVGFPMTGTGFSLNFGLETASGTYTVVASSASTGCSNNMTGNANVVINTPPTAFNVTGGGNYCAAGSGTLVGLDGSVSGTEYQLMNGLAPVGSPVHGTGSAISFGLQTAAGTYTVVATSLSTTCTNTMAGSTTINIVPLPAAETVSAGGNYCAGTGGIDISLASSQSTVNYQLYNGTVPVGVSITGSGSSLDFGSQTAGGTYTIIGTAAGPGGCSNTMSGAPVIVVDPLPTAYTISGGGNYCAGGAGVHITLSGSNTGIHYQLMNGGPVGTAMPGTGSALDFGSQTASGAYTIMATNTATGCVNTMAGTVAITINPLPNLYTVSSSASNYCAGGDGVDVQLSGSDAGLQYQLYDGSTTLGSPVTGTGFDIDFGLQTLAGTYTVVAMNTATSCNANMTSAATIVINPLPTAYTVIGGGNYCSGGTGVHVGLNSSNTGISYQLYVSGGTTVGLPMMGTGLPLDFGLQTTSGTYTVVATNAGTACTRTMSGSAVITTTVLPAVNTVTGGGPYCAGATGVHVGLNGSTAGVNYQLYNGVSLVGTPVAGTGIAIDFGLQTAVGTYTVMGLNSATSCSSNMAGSATVTINSLPSAYTVIGGGNFCPGGDGVNVGLGGSGTGISYQLYNGSAPAGSAMLGTGAAISFGLKTDAGTYSVVAANSATGCTSNMSGTVSVGLNPLPGVYTVIGGGNYCAGGTGVHVGLTGSAIGINYQLSNTSGSIGFPVAGTGGPLDFGPQTAASSYTVVAANGTTGCTNNMDGTAAIVVNPTVSPSVTLSTGIGDVVCSGRSVTLSTTTANGGSAPVYSWSINGSPVGGAGSTYSYMPEDGDVISVVMTSNATCATPATVGNSLTLSVLPVGNPTVSIAASPGITVCQGTMVAYNNSNTLGGTPSFTWIVNGANASTAPSYAYTPNNGDVVYVIMNSTYLCALESTVTSNHITMEVDDSLIPTVNINAYPGTDISAGESVTLTASVLNGGSAPSYQWFVNGVPVPGANAASYTSSNFANGDSVSCLVTASGGCTGLSSFNTVRIVVGTTGVNQVVANNSNIQLVPNPNNGNFTIKGSLGTTADEEVSVEITDMLGQVIYKDKVMTHGGNIDQKIQLSSSIANGMYILNLNSGGANNVFHVIIEQ